MIQKNRGKKTLGRAVLYYSTAPREPQPFMGHLSLNLKQTQRQ